MRRSKRVVRFKDLTQIREEDGAQAGEITLEVPILPAPAPSSPDPQQQKEAQVESSAEECPKEEEEGEIVPAACPFGERIARERAAARQSKVKSNSAASNQETLDASFPRNVLLRQREERANNARVRPRTAGVNPDSGKERGTSFIATRSYVSDLTDPPLSPTSPPPRPPLVPRPPRPGSAAAAVTSRPLADLTAAAGYNPQQQATPLEFHFSEILSNPQSVTALQETFAETLVPLETSSPTSHQPDLPTSQGLTVAGISYKPDPQLSKTVNPYCPPRQQIYGSAAYQLRDVDRDKPNRPNTASASSVNQYLHQVTQSSQLPSEVRTGYNNTGILLESSDRPPVLINLAGVQNKGDLDYGAQATEDTVGTGGEIQSINRAPSLQFLRDNCASPVPITKETLFHCSAAEPKPSPRDNFIQPGHSNTTSYNVGSVSSYPQTLPHTKPITSSSALVQTQLDPLPSESIQLDSTKFAAQHIQTSSSGTALIVPQPAPTSLLTQSTSSLPIEPLQTTNIQALPLEQHTEAAPMTSFVGNVAPSGGIVYGLSAPPPVPLSRVQEKEELQRLNERFSSYIARVRQLGQAANNVDTSAFLRSSKILEDEILQLKTMYETELDKLRRELDASGHERNSLHVHFNKQTKQIGELTDRLSIETDKNAKLLDEINVLQRKSANLELEIQDIRLANQRPQQDLDNKARQVEALTREVEAWKHRYEHEQVARQELEDKNQQLVKRVEFAESVHGQQVNDYQTRLDTASAAILNLESRVRELSTADVNVNEMLRQVREAAEAELRAFLVESEEQYSRNLSSLKAQIDADADTIQRMSQEKTELIGSIGELQAKIRNLEGQVVNLTHQKSTLEDAVVTERRRAADQVRQLEVKVKHVQDMLVAKMREVSTARESSLPLKAEIEALKAMLEDEEKRLRVPLGIVPASLVQQPTITAPPPTATQILNTPSLTALKASNQMSYSQASALNQQQAANTAFVQGVGDVVKTSAVQQIGTSVPVDSCVLTISQSAVPQPPQATTAVAPMVVGAASSGTGAPVAATTTVSASQVVPTASNIVTTTDGNTINLTANYNYSANYPTIGGPCNPLYPYEPSPPLNTLYVPEALRTTEEGGVAYDADYGIGTETDFDRPDQHDYNIYLQSVSLPMSGPRYHYETTPSANRLHLLPSPPHTPRAIGPIPGSRVKSAPAAADTSLTAVKTAEYQQQEHQQTGGAGSNVNLIPANLGCGRDYFDQMFTDLQRDTLFSKPRPKSSPLERRLPSTFHDYTVSTSR